MPVFDEQFQVEATPERVWALLLDPVRLGPCIPGCAGIEVEDARTYRLRLVVKVGFLSTTQDMRMTVTEMEPPRRLVAVGHGEDRKLGSQVDVRSTLDLEPAGAHATDIHYQSEVKVLGRLGSVGDAVMRMKAGQLAGEFATRLRAAVEAGP
ncbi:MAG TPA: SRPBCC domain-containing protein [Candidatus Dormibacteraeota bacterium]|nr:SRPBCC domain-containing protein [Candidatus Dormibacteraeota bacterium]